MTTAWAHLPNAIHIDRVVALAKAYPDVDFEQPDRYDAAFIITWREAYESTMNSGRFEICSTARYLLKMNYWSSDALTCLCAYDDCGYMMGSEVGELKILAAFGNGRAILLLPAVIAFESIKGKGWYNRAEIQYAANID
jgi:hypothetical protein